MLTALIVGIALLAPISVSSQGGCSQTDVVTGNCNTGDTDVVIDGTWETDGNPEGPGDDDWTPPTDEPWTPPGLDECLNNWESYLRCFRQPVDDDEATEDEPEVPTITITDLARFTPEGSIVTGEPDNVGVAGLPTNFVTTASVQTVAGELFGFPISVRFTPSAYDFAYGDGAAVTTTSGGSTWAALGQAQFTPTDTSHTYRERGAYIAQVDVRYTAEVDFGIGWFPLTGEVTSAGAPQEVRIFEAHTALVAHTCEQAPASPGC